MKMGTVINAAPELIGKTALLRPDPASVDRCLAQFNEPTVYNGKDLSVGWHSMMWEAFDYNMGED